MPVGEDRYTREDDAKRIAELLQPANLHLPSCPTILRFQFELGSDIELEPAIRVWVVLDDTETPPEGIPPTKAQEITDAVWRAFSEAKIRGWPLVFFRRASEQAAIDRR